MKFIQNNSTVLDVGANNGEWSRAVLRELKGNVRLFMFEPQEECWRILSDLADAGALLVKSAVGNSNGEAVLYSPSGRAGNASLHIRKDTYFVNQLFSPTTVSVVSIDNFIETNEVMVVDFMKMDIEGHELFALKGASKALADGRIRALSFEFGSGNINSRTFFRDYWDMLTDYNYQLFRVLPGGQMLAVPRYYENLEYYRGVSNYIAVNKRVDGTAQQNA